MNNAVYGKTQEVELVTDAYTLHKRVAKPSFYRGNPITDCLNVVQCRVATLTLNRPIYIGFVVLELSELHMYDFHYNHMKVKYPSADQLQLLFTDTDSLVYAVQTKNIYEDMASDAPTRYDFIEKKTAKGVKEKVKKDYLHFSHYLDTLCTFKSYV